jgi:serpin B
MPRLTLRYGESLKSALKALGMARAFDSNAAQLYDMYVRRGAFNAFVGEVRQKTYLHVDEAGSEAAAVTAVEIGITAMRPGAPPFVMPVDHPYFLAIADDRTGALLFAGGINRP